MLFSLRIKNLLTSVALVALVGSIAMPCTLTAGNEKFKDTEIAKYDLNLTAPQKASLAAMVAVFFYFLTKTPTNDPARVTCKELRDLLFHPTKFIAALKEDYQGTLAKFWYFIDDAIIGTQYCSSSAKTDKDTGRTYVKSGSCAPKGIIGNIHAYIKYVRRGFGTGLALTLLIDGKTREGLLKLQTPNLAALAVALGLATL